MVGLMDCNNFFVSCERLFRPDLRNKPVAVLSSNDGCIVARSQEVKDMGIPMGAPLFQVKDIIKSGNVVLFSSNFTLYRDISSRVMKALREEYAEISVYSIDEAFFNIREDSIMSIREARDRIMQKTGIPVSFGVGPTKTIAKLASNEAKQGNGVAVYKKDQISEKIGRVGCGSVWGIGRQMAQRLESLGITTVESMLGYGLSFMRKEFGVHGERVFLELTGIPTEIRGEEEDVSVSIMSTQSFNHTKTKRDVLLSALGYHVSNVARRLREQGLMAQSLSIICAPSRHSDYRFRLSEKRIDLETPTNDTISLIKYATTLFESLYEDTVPYKRAGAVVSRLIPQTYTSKNLFTENDDDRSVSALMDTINKKNGKNTVRLGSVFDQTSWMANSNLRSPQYTTQWSEIVTVKAV